MSLDISRWAYIWEFCKDEFVLCKGRNASEDPLVNCLIYDTFNGEYYIIENNDLAHAVKQRMFDAGIPILASDDLPTPKNSTERALQEMWNQGKSDSEIQAALAPIRERDQARWRKIDERYKQRNARPPT